MASSQDVLPPPLNHPSLKKHQQRQDIIPHPNGSEGWLPAEAFNAPIKQDTDTPAGATTTLRRSTISTSPRKSAFHSRTSSTQPSTVHPTDGKQTSALVNGTETTPPAVADEELQNRAVSANNNLTPKQRHKIAKSEGQNELSFWFFFVDALTDLFSEGWETHFQNYKAGRKDREASCGYRH